MRVPGFRFVQAAGNYTDRDGLHYGIAVHATSNTASDEAESSYASHREDGTSAHAYVDWDSLTQALDTDRKAGHAGSAYGNENAIAIEFTGLDSWTRQKWLDSIAWSQVGAWIAYILQHDPDYRGFQVRRATVQEMRDNPKVKAFYGHDDMRRAWGGTDHTDPGPNFPWDRLFAAVNAALNPSAAAGGTVPTKYEQAALNADNALYHALNGDNPIVGNKSVDNGAAVTFPNILAAMKLQLDELIQRPAAGNVTPTPEQWAALTASITGLIENLFAQKVGAAAELAAEAAVRKVLGSLDGAVPPA